MSLSILGKTTYRWSMRALGRGPRLRRVFWTGCLWNPLPRLNFQSLWIPFRVEMISSDRSFTRQIVKICNSISKMSEFLYYSLINTVCLQFTAIYIGLGWGARAASSSPLGFVGLGKIGSGMVTNLTKERRVEVRRWSKMYEVVDWHSQLSH